MRSKTVPITWKADQIDGPAFRTYIRIFSPFLTAIGWSLYWFAKPLKVMTSGCLASIFFMSASLPGLPT